MKVLVIFPDKMNKPTGGLGVQLQNLYQRLSNKIDFYIAGYPDDDNIIENYIGVSNYIPSLGHGSLNVLYGHSIYVTEALKFPKPDLIHAYDWSTYLAGVCLSKIHNVPLLVTMQLSINALQTKGIYNCVDEKTIDGAWLHRTHTELELLGLNTASKIIHVSKGYSNYFSHLDYDDKSVVIPNGVDLKSWTPKNKITLPGNNKYKIVYIGRFALMKSVDILAQIDLPDNVDLIFVGASYGGDAKCCELIEHAVINKPNFYYYGPAYDQEKIDILESADAVIIPSTHEPFGIVGLEGLASKSIVISSRVDGLGDFLDDSNSIKCGITKEGIELGIYKFLSLSQEQKDLMIQNGLEVCKKYNWDDIADQYYQVYESFNPKNN